MTTHRVGRIQSETPEAATEWLQGLVRYADLVRSDENVRARSFGADPLDQPTSLAVELAKAILLIHGKDHANDTDGQVHRPLRGVGASRAAESSRSGDTERGPSVEPTIRAQPASDARSAESSRGGDREAHSSRVRPIDDLTFEELRQLLVAKREAKRLAMRRYRAKRKNR